MNPGGTDSSELDEVEKKIEQFKEQSRPAEGRVAGPGLVFSICFAVLGALWMGDHFGRYLSEKAGNPHYSLVGWGLGFALAGLTVYRLLRPYMK